ncbi:aminotransferase class V-fold PLP-dependent enzyme [Nonomuraea dietziae]|uniref:aminotransferase class V-fold PLP-dependent enzyme n=1 Tax=Nonomuraea dietziae TaxID=65515 RepID=UPI003421B805
MDLDAARKLWEPAPGWLNTASYGLPPRPALDDLHTALTQWRHGSTDWQPWDDTVTRSRAAFATLIGAPADDITLSSTASQIFSQIATALPPGSRVLVPDIEFTSNVYPWAMAAHVDTAPPDRLAEAITPHTSAVAFSLIQSATGHKAPLADIIEAARAHDTLVIADASQACGWLPVTTDGLDALACAAYKWLMCPRGAAFGYLSPRLRARMRPTAANWYSGTSMYGMPLTHRPGARAFDLSPAWFSYVAAAPTLELLNQLDLADIHAHNLALANRFRAGAGLPPGDSAIVSLDTDALGTGAETGRHLERAGVRAAVRAGKLRVSFHLYTSESDVDLALQALT